MAKKTVAAKKRNVKVDANGQLHVIHLSTILLFLSQTVKGRSFLGHLPVKWDLEVLRRTLLMQRKWLPKIVQKLHLILA